MTQTIVRALDTNFDWTFGAGNGNYLSGNAAIAQQIRCRLLEFLNNCFFNMGAGIDWLNLLGGKNDVLLQLAITAMILNTNGVTGIILLNVDLSQERAFNIQYSVTTVFSKVTSSVYYQMAA